MTLGKGINRIHFDNRKVASSKISFFPNTGRNEAYNTSFWPEKKYERYLVHFWNGILVAFDPFIDHI